MRIQLKSLSLIIGCLFAANIYAQSAHDGHGANKAEAKTPATAEFIKAMDDMHKPMMEGIKATDPDRAFIEGMIPHHQGAIDMAKIVIKYGKDSEVRKLAENIIKAQESEIAWMNQWLKDHPAKK